MRGQRQGCALAARRAAIIGEYFAQGPIDLRVAGDELPADRAQKIVRAQHFIAGYVCLDSIVLLMSSARWACGTICAMRCRISSSSMRAPGRTARRIAEFEAGFSSNAFATSTQRWGRSHS